MPVFNCQCAPCLTLDCSPEAQARRRQQIDDIMARMSSGVSSVSDRSRSVTYRDPKTLWPMLLRLQNELAACMLGRFPGRSSLSVVDQVKGL